LAANVFLDAFAIRLRAEGVRATSIAWGLWEPAGTGMTARLDETTLGLIERHGIKPMSVASGLELLDRALSLEEPNIVAAALDARMWEQADRDSRQPPALVREFVRRPANRSGSIARPSDGQGSGAALQAQLNALDAVERGRVLLDIVRSEVGRTGRLDGPAAVPADKPLKDIGIDSLMALELRSCLAARLGLTLPATLIFDYPTPQDLASYLDTALSAEQSASSGNALLPLNDEREIRSLLARIPLSSLQASGLLSGLLRLAPSRADALAPDGEAPFDAAQIETIADEDLLKLAFASAGEAK
jgi:type I polyketide synthase PikAII